MAKWHKNVYLEEVHLSSIRRPFNCSFCGSLKFFHNYDSFKAHSRRHSKIYGKPVTRDFNGNHKNLNLTSLNINDIFSDEFTDVDIYALMNVIMDSDNVADMIGCLVCDKSFPDHLSLQEHEREAHKGPKPFSCRKCKVRFHTNGQLRYHKDKCHGAKDAFKCSVCRAVFMTRGSFLRHEKQHENYKQYKCKHCEKTFSHKKYFEAHETLHETGGKRPFKCSMCKSSFIIRNHLTQHEKIHTSTRLYQCDQCPAAFPTNARLTRHIKAHLNYKKFQCDHCQKSFSDLKYLAAHEKLHTTDEKEKVALAECKSKEQQKRQEYCCKHCQKTFFSHQYLVAHEVSHSGERPYKCKLCDCSYIIRSHLTAHVKLHNTERAFECDVCGKAFHTNARLKRHGKSHTSLKKLVCHICRKTVRSYKRTTPFICQSCEKDLSKNEDGEDESDEQASRSNVGGSNFYCKCGAKFRSKIMLRIHMEGTHTPSKYSVMVTCNECNCEFKSKSELLKHAKKIHKSYMCTFCLDTFNSAQLLTKHEAEHINKNSELKCPNCEKAFGLLQPLGQHLRDEHGVEEPYICVVCGEGFSRKSNGKEHLREAHPGRIMPKTIAKVRCVKSKIHTYKSSADQNENESVAAKSGISSADQNNLENKAEDIETSDEDEEAEESFVHFSPLNTKSSMDNIIETFLDKNSVDSTQALEKVLMDPKSKQMALGNAGSDAVKKCLDNLEEEVTKEMHDEQGEYCCEECGMSFMHKSSWLLHQQFHCDTEDEEQG